jgi:hypothetical protein
MNSSAEMFHKHAANIASERLTQYGEASTAMAALATHWSITLGQPVAPAHVVLCLIDLKLARLAHEPTHGDSGKRYPCGKSTKQDLEKDAMSTVIEARRRLFGVTAKSSGCRRGANRRC